MPILIEKHIPCKKVLTKEGKKRWTPIKSLCKCDKCGEEFIKDKSLALKRQQNLLCPTCFKEYFHIYKKIDINDLKREGLKKGLFLKKEELSEVDRNTLVDWTCHKGHSVKMRYSSLLYSQGCKFCNTFLNEEDYKQLGQDVGLEFLGPLPNSNCQLTNWKCRCGKVFKRSHGNVSKARNKERGSICKKCYASRFYKDLSGQKIGAVTIISPYLRESYGVLKTKYLCRCDCGTEFVTNGSTLYSGLTQSCGCRCHKTGNQSHLFKGYGEIPQRYFYDIVNRSKQYGFPIDITIEYIWELFLAQERKCVLSDMDLKFSTTSRKRDGTASLDRIDSNKGYIVGNVQWLHKDVNMMKRVFSDEYFIETCIRVANKFTFKNV